ncbi:hypothetical protein DAC16_10 [Bacteroides phage DAC16]|nr:hypothetical protein DAC16_10 [Bacteroides phage DAC16]QIG64288.1 hypothetical protein DAC23_10 [Bacteroides phage DAC23]
MIKFSVAIFSICFGLVFLIFVLIYLDTKEELKGEVINKEIYYEAPTQVKSGDFIIPIESSQNYKIIYKCDTIISSVKVKENIYYLAEEGDSIFKKDGIISLKKKK